MDLGENEDDGRDGDASNQKQKKKKDKSAGGIKIQEINDVETLEKILKESISRGQKQRIKKKLRKLQGIEEIPKGKQAHLALDQAGNPNPDEAELAKSKAQEPKWTAKEKIEHIMKKREKKLENKEKTKQ